MVTNDFYIVKRKDNYGFDTISLHDGMPVFNKRFSTWVQDKKTGYGSKIADRLNIDFADEIEYDVPVLVNIKRI